MRSRGLLISAWCLALGGSLAQAANITWTTGPTFNGPTGFNALSANGFLLEAADTDWVPNGGLARIVDPSGKNIKFNPRNYGGLNQVNFASGSPGSTDAGWNAVIDSSDFHGGNYTVAPTGPGLTPFLSGLTPGRQYQVQLFASDARGCCNTRTQFFTDGNGNNSATFVQGSFTSILGTFTADAATQNIGISANSNAPILNALAVRDVTPAAPFLSSTTFTVKPDSVNRLIGPGAGLQNTHFDDFFSTHGSGPQNSLVQLTSATLNAALDSALQQGGPVKITSATLTIGSPADDYAQPSTAHEVLTAYNPLTVTWNSFNNGGVAGVNYDALAEAVGVVSGSTTTFDLTAYVQSIVDGGPDRGLFFPTSLLGNNANFTENANLVFSITAVSTPEPGGAMIWSLAGMVGAAWIVTRRRKQRG